MSLDLTLWKSASLDLTLWVSVSLDLRPKTQAQIRFFHQGSSHRQVCVWPASPPSSSTIAYFRIDLAGVQLFSQLNSFIKEEAEAERGLKA